MSVGEIKSATIVGGTGTLGKAILKSLSENHPHINITVVSRDEHKQAALKREFPKTNFVIADVRDFESIAPALYNRDLVFHVAAMKHVDICEANPDEAMKTNYTGTKHVAKACQYGNVKYCVFSSTDKAVEPITHYGYTKAAAESLLYNYNRAQSNCRFSVYRWGNVLGSQGSVIPTFIKSLTEQKRITLTHPDMTRFWLPIDWPVNYMLRTFDEAYKDRAMVPPNMKAASVLEVAETLAVLLNVKGYIVETTGIRGKEKLHETMYESGSPYFLRSDASEKYTREELAELLSPFVRQLKVAA